MNITHYQKQLRKLFPTAIITVHMDEKFIKWELKITPSISEEEHISSFQKIKEIFGDTFKERYTEETGHHFYIHQSYTSPSVNN